MIEIPWEICGHETLGVRIDDEADPRYGKIPIPPTMDTQLDQIVIKHVLEPLRKKLVAKLEEKISPPKPETWFETYLTAFILLSHIERLAKHSESHARLHTMRVSFLPLSILELITDHVDRPNIPTTRSLKRCFTLPRSSSLASTLSAMDQFLSSSIGSRNKRRAWHDLTQSRRSSWRRRNSLSSIRVSPLPSSCSTHFLLTLWRAEHYVLELRSKHVYEQSLYWTHQLFFEDWDNSPSCVIEVN